MAQAFRSTRVETPRGRIAATLLVEGGRIVELRAWDDVPGAVELHDFGSHILMPGLVDTHVHINEPGRTDWEGFETATRAAAAGGVTTLVDMPLNCVPETIDVSALEAKRAAARGKAWVDWAAWGGVVRGNSGQIKPLAAAGVCGFKCFLIHSGIEGFAWVDEAELRLALEQLRGTGLPLLAHAELAGPVDEATRALNASGADWRKYSTYLASRPDEAEIDAIAMLIRLAEEYDAHVHIVHLSSAKALPLLDEARRRGVHITVETCVHYLRFTSGGIKDGAMECRYAPPIRDAGNRESLLQALHSGLIDMVTTDHSPCPPAMKYREDGRWDLAWGGIAGLGFALPLIWDILHRRNWSFDWIVKWMAEKPAGLAALQGRKGALVPGADADFVVFDDRPDWTIRVEDVNFRHKLSPYCGERARGRVLETWLRGTRVYRHGEFNGEPRGRELVRG